MTIPSEYEYTNTGGGSTAYVRTLHTQAAIYITTEDGPCAPSDEYPDDKVLLTFSLDGACIRQEEYVNITAALAALPDFESDAFLLCNTIPPFGPR